MDKRIKKTLWLLLAVAIVFPVLIVLTASFSASAKGMVHFTTSLIFLVLLFNVWSSFKRANSKKILYTILVISGFIIALPVGIELVSPLPIFIKGIAHFLLVAIFVGLFIWVWKDEEKASN